MEPVNGIGCVKKTLIQLIGQVAIEQLEAQLQSIVEGTGYGEVRIEIRDGKPFMIHTENHFKFDRRK